MKKNFFSAIFLILISCTGKVEYQYPDDPAIVRKSRSGKFFKDELSLYGKKDQKKSEIVSNENQNPLWAASIAVVSDLLPISTIDKNSGTIVTEWYEQDKNKSQRIKINVLVKNDKVDDKNLEILLFRQEKDKGGNWLDKQSDETSTIKLIKEQILDKAKILAKK